MLKINGQLFLALIGVFGGLGVYVGYITVDQFQVFVNASLGFAVLYLLHKQFLSSNKGAKFPMKEQFQLPSDLRYFAYSFFLAVIMFWASIQILHLLGFGGVPAR